MNIAGALAEAGVDERFRNTVFEALRQAELDASDPAVYRNQVRWPMILSLLNKAGIHRVVLDSGLMFDVGPDSRIEQALLLSRETHPDHVWEPQTTRLLTALAVETVHAIVGGAYIGDQVLPMARAMAPNTVHAFEPMQGPFDRLLHHIQLNQVSNVCANRLCLWNSSDIALSLEGESALAISTPSTIPGTETVQSITIDDYVSTRQLPSVGLIMLDTEGGEHNALLGSVNLLARPFPDAPHVVFEVHRSYVDWSHGLANTPIVGLLISNGYTVFGIRDYHDNHSMRGEPIEVIPVDRIYLEGPPHGFNLLATKDDGLVRRLDLRVVENVSPKLLADRDPRIHHPLSKRS